MNAQTKEIPTLKSLICDALTNEDVRNRLSIAINERINIPFINEKQEKSIIDPIVNVVLDELRDVIYESKM